MAKARAAPSISAAQAAVFRLERHHLHPARGAAPSPRVVDVVRDIGGVQAQLMSAAEIALWTRRRQTTRDEIRAALYERREIVKTSAMRTTLHLIAADHLAEVIAALKPMSMAMMGRWQARAGATPEHVKALVDSIVEGLREGPRTQQELTTAARRGASKGMRLWLDNVWGPMRTRPALVEGVIVYGPVRGVEATFVRVDRWLGRQRTLGLDEARARLARTYLSAYGPATFRDFAKWSGLKSSDARVVFDAIEGDIAEVSVDGAAAAIRREDLAALMRSRLDDQIVRLLGPFDPFLLAHATKEHLVEPQYGKRVYRPQGWISPVVLAGDRIVAVWFSKVKGSAMEVDVQPFKRLDQRVRDAVEQEADALGAFLGTRCAVRFTA
jgi:uncharacterized protein YcaQ